MSSLKLVFEEEIRRVAAPATVSMAEILRLARELFPAVREALSLKLSYSDDEGDTVTLNSEKELKEALAVMALQNVKVIRFHVVLDDRSDFLPAPGGAGNTVHQGITCDSCGVGPIVGIRYKCTVRDDYDLCSTCESKQQPREYPMLKVYLPTSLPRQGAYSVDTAAASFAAEKNSEHRPPVHRHIRCDRCGVLPIVGSRFKCTVRPDYDLCESCQANDQSGFKMTKIDVPMGGRWGMCAKRAVKRCVGDSRPPIHRYVQCDGCGMYPLVGTRFNCSVRPNYDLCESCKEGEGGKYPMTKIEAPQAGFGPCRGGRIRDSSASWRKKCSNRRGNGPNTENADTGSLAKNVHTVAAAVLGDVLMTDASAANVAEVQAQNPAASPAPVPATTFVSHPEPMPLISFESNQPSAPVTDGNITETAELRSLEDSLLEAALKESIVDSSSSNLSTPAIDELPISNPTEDYADDSSGGSLTPSEGFEAFHMLRMEEIANACSDDEAEERKVVGVALTTTEADAVDTYGDQASSVPTSGASLFDEQGEKWQKELALLSEMGFNDRNVVVTQLEAIAGATDRTVEGDLPADTLVRVIAALMGVNQL